MNNIYTLQAVEIGSLSFLNVISTLSDEATCHIYLPLGTSPERSSFDGVVTAIFKIGGKEVGLIFNDFRMNGGSFGQENSVRITKFLQRLEAMSIPAVYIANSSGVRIMEGRRVFDSAFGLLPALKKFADKNLLITFAVGKCIGLGAVIFGYGQYRIAVRDTGQINLTGPEVFKLFFSAQENFNQAACPERYQKKSHFVQELVESKEVGLERIRAFLMFAYASRSSTPPAQEFCPLGEKLDVSLLNPSVSRLDALLQNIGEEHFEVFPDMSPVVRTYVVRRKGKTYGLFVNPPGHAKNMITANGLVRYIAGLQLFKRLKLPIISLLDSPGGDPRSAESDKNFVGLYVDVINEIIDYDFPKMGIVIGRCFGGATVLLFPKIFGGEILAVEKAQIGIMHAEIIDQLLSGAPRLLSQWAEVKAQQKADLGDLVAEGSVERVIKREEIGAEIDFFLLDETDLIQPSRDAAEGNRPPDLRPQRIKGL